MGVNNSFRARTYCGILYPNEDPSHLFAIQHLRSSCNFVGIDHDMDIDAEGHLKKEHTHFIVRFPNARYMSAVAKELGILENYIQPCNDVKGYARYMVHLDDPDKAQYDPDRAYGNMKEEFIRYVDGSTECSRVREVVKLLDSIEHTVTYREFLLAICDAGLFAEFRKLGFGIKDLIEEHNSKYVLFYDF